MRPPEFHSLHELMNRCASAHPSLLKPTPPIDRTNLIFFRDRVSMNYLRLENPLRTSWEWDLPVVSGVVSSQLVPIGVDFVHPQQTTAGQLHG